MEAGQGSGDDVKSQNPCRGMAERGCSEVAFSRLIRNGAPGDNQETGSWKGFD